jgi:hypothetical protein
MLRCVRAAAMAQRLQRSSFRSVLTRRPITSQAAAAEQPQLPPLSSSLTKSILCLTGLVTSGSLAIGWWYSSNDLTFRLSTRTVASPNEPADVVRDAAAKLRAGESGDEALFEV